MHGTSEAPVDGSANRSGPVAARAYEPRLKTLRRLRNDGSQVVRAEHVHVNEGGQALIGNVKSTPGPGRLEDNGKC